MSMSAIYQRWLNWNDYFDSALYEAVDSPKYAPAIKTSIIWTATSCLFQSTALNPLLDLPFFASYSTLKMGIRVAGAVASLGFAPVALYRSLKEHVSTCSKKFDRTEKVVGVAASALLSVGFGTMLYQNPIPAGYLWTAEACALTSLFVSFLVDKSRPDFEGQRQHLLDSIKELETNIEILQAMKTNILQFLEENPELNQLFQEKFRKYRANNFFVQVPQNDTYKDSQDLYSKEADRRHKLHRLEVEKSEFLRFLKTEPELFTKMKEAAERWKEGKEGFSEYVGDEKSLSIPETQKKSE